MIKGFDLNDEIDELLKRIKTIQVSERNIIKK